jgi:hypothetical protein
MKLRIIAFALPKTSRFCSGKRGAAIDGSQIAETSLAWQSQCNRAAEFVPKNERFIEHIMALALPGHIRQLEENSYLNAVRRLEPTRNTKDNPAVVLMPCLGFGAFCSPKQ